MRAASQCASRAEQSKGGFVGGCISLSLSSVPAAHGDHTCSTSYLGDHLQPSKGRHILPVCVRTAVFNFTNLEGIVVKEDRPKCPPAVRPVQFSLDLDGNLSEDVTSTAAGWLDPKEGGREGGRPYNRPVFGPISAASFCRRLRSHSTGIRPSRWPAGHCLHEQHLSHLSVFSSFPNLFKQIEGII